MNDDNNKTPFDKLKDLFGNEGQEETENNTQENTQERITLQEVQNMTFPTEEEQKIQQEPIIDKEEVARQKKLARREKFRKVKNKIRKILIIPELILLILLVLFLRNKYLNYSNNVEQEIIYEYVPYRYEIHRKNYDFHVKKMKGENCENKVCNPVLEDEYDITFEKYQMFLIRTYFDTTFRFKNGKKNQSIIDLRTELSSRSMHSLIQNDAKFLELKSYKKYKITDYEQKSEFKTRGFQYEELEGRFYLTISLGKKEENGYTMTITDVHQEGTELIFYFSEEYPPTSDHWQNETTPALSIEIEEKPSKIRVKNIKNGEELVDNGYVKEDSLLGLLP